MVCLFILFLSTLENVLKHVSCSILLALFCRHSQLSTCVSRLCTTGVLSEFTFMQGVQCWLLASGDLQLWLPMPGECWKQSQAQRGQDPGDCPGVSSQYLLGLLVLSLWNGPFFPAQIRLMHVFFFKDFCVGSGGREASTSAQPDTSLETG